MCELDIFIIRIFKPGPKSFKNMVGEVEDVEKRDKHFFVSHDELLEIVDRLGRRDAVKLA